MIPSFGEVTLSATIRSNQVPLFQPRHIIFRRENTNANAKANVDQWMRRLGHLKAPDCCHGRIEVDEFSTHLTIAMVVGDKKYEKSWSFDILSELHPVFDDAVKNTIAAILSDLMSELARDWAAGTVTPIFGAFPQERS